MPRAHDDFAQTCGRPAAATLRNPDRLVAELATAQRGVVAQAQLVAAGLTVSAISRRVAAGRLHRLHRGVYAVGHTALPFTARLQAASLACGAHSTICSWSTAASLGLCPPRLPIHVNVSGGRGRRHAGLVIHGGTLAPIDVVVRGGLRHTSWARTMLDIAADADLDEVVALLDRSAARRLAATAPLLEVLSRGAGRSGARRLRQALLVVHPQGVLTRSELERRGLRMVRRHRLPIPEVNARLHGYEVDLLWRHANLIVELDGREYHDPERDTRRDNNLRSHGWTTARFTWRQVVNDEAWVVERLTDFLA